MSSRRRKAREVAVQMLYQQDLNPDTTHDAVRRQIHEELADAVAEQFAWTLFTGTMESRKRIDERVQNYASNWAVSRMPATDRNVIRLGAFELLYTDTPHKVVIDEAVGLAKTFGGPNSTSFVNGILDRLVPEEKRSKVEATTDGPSTENDSDEEPQDDE